jgi:MscS family membrane protein
MISLFFVGFTSWIVIFIPALGLGNDVMVTLKRVFGALMLFASTNFALNAIEVWFRIMTRHEPKGVMTARKGALTFVMAILKIVTVVVGLVFIVSKLGFDVAGLLTGISIGGFAFALGAQETIKNFFGSIMIFLDKPFQVGDWVIVNGEEGTVEEVGLRSSKIRTFYNSVVIIPNSQVANMTIDNLQQRKYRRYKTYFKLPLNTDIEKIETFLEELDKLVNTHKNTRKDFYHIRVNNIGTYSIEILFYIFFIVPDWTSELKARQEIILSVLRIAKEIGVKFAVPPVVGVDL